MKSGNVALPCELTEKLTGTTVRAKFHQIYYTNILIILHTFFTRIRGGDYNASSGFGLWARTLRGQLKNAISHYALLSSRANNSEAPRLK